MAPLVGADLAAARERLGRSLPEMAAALRIRLPYLAALEQGRLAELPGNAYALAFLRSYAAALGLDPSELSRRFKIEAAEVGGKAELAFPSPLPERGLPAGAFALLGLVLAVGAYAGWYHLSGEGRAPPEAVAPVPARLAPLAERALPPASAPVAVATAPSSATADAAPAAASGAAPADGATAASPNSNPPAVMAGLPSTSPRLTVAAADAGLSPSSAAAATPTASQQPPLSATQSAAGGASAVGLLVRATADAWIQVRDRTGQVLFSRILRAGESWPVPDVGSLLLTTGNAGGTELVLNGVATPPLGNPGAVRRDLTLDPDAVRSGRLAPIAATR